MHAFFLCPATRSPLCVVGIQSSTCDGQNTREIECFRVFSEFRLFCLRESTSKVEDYGSILEMSSLCSSGSIRLYLFVATLEDHVSPEVE